MFNIECKARNPETCRYHGIKQFSDHNKAGQQVIEALNDSRTFLLNRETRKELLRNAYTKDTFLHPADYNEYITYEQLHRDPKAEKFFEAESEWQQQWAKENIDEYQELRLSIWNMTKSPTINAKIRNGAPLLKSERLTLEHLETAFDKIPERSLSNRLFRGYSFDSSQDFGIWINNHTDSSLVITLEEYIRASAYARVAFSFSSKRPYPVIFEYLTKSGIYTQKFSPAPQEAEVILDRKKPFRISNTYMTTVHDTARGLNQSLRIVQLQDS